MNLADLLRSAALELEGLGIEDAETDARLLLQHAAGLTRTGLYLQSREECSQQIADDFKILLARRKKREPVAYILGEQEFWSLPFLVTPDVLIPRPETEFLLEAVLDRYNKKDVGGGWILDLCCGSGVIAVVLARELKQPVVAVDLSWAALEISRKNSRRHGCEERIAFVCSDLLSAFQKERRFSLIVSNPPYIDTNVVQNDLQPEVSGYEPHLALDGGTRGMDVIEKIYHQLVHLLLPGGEFFMEFGADQGKIVYDLFASADQGPTKFFEVQILQDYAGRDRVLRAVRNLN